MPGSTAWAMEEETLQVVAVAIDRDKNSQFAVKWAVDNLLDNKSFGSLCFLVHVRSHSIHSQDEAVPKEGRPPTEAELREFFIPYRGYCARKGMNSKEVVLSDLDIPSALLDFVQNNNIGNIVVGASNRNVLTRRLKDPDVPTSLLKSAPDSCSVYVISKGKVQCSRIASKPQTHVDNASLHRSPYLKALLSKVTYENPKIKFGRTNSSASSYRTRSDRTSISFISDSFKVPDKLKIKNEVKSSRSSTAPPTPSSARTSSSFISDSFEVTLPDKLKIKNYHVKSSTPSTGTQTPSSARTNNSFISDPFEVTLPDRSRTNPGRASNSIVSDSFKVTRHDRWKTKDEAQSSTTPSTGSETPESPQRISISQNSTFSGLFSRQSTNISGRSSGCCADDDSSLTSQVLEEEMWRLREELKRYLEMYKSISEETVASTEEAGKLQQWIEAEKHKLEKARLSEEEALAVAETERQKTNAAKEAAQMSQLLADMEVQKRKLSELKAKREAEVKQKALYKMANNKPVCRKYTIDEIEAATDHFNMSLKIGEGAYGPVFKGTHDHRAVAIKILRPNISQGQKQFQQEVEVLSRMRHPHMVLLMGACPEYGCLVYEYMENGSLEDRLFCKDNTPPIPWRIRFRIAAEIATGLLFLHQTKPAPLVHRDLKPANILLDRNYVSKIGDVGLAKLVPSSVADTVTQYHLTVARGTFCYIDPEYQQSGMLGVKSDLYSLGVVLLQLLTSRPPMGLTVQVKEAIQKGTFADVLDPRVLYWPVEEALSLAKLALHCCELRKKDRPDLASVVLPELNRLKDLSSRNEANERERVVCQTSLYNSVQKIESQKNQEGMTNYPNVEMEIQT